MSEEICAKLLTVLFTLNRADEIEQELELRMVDSQMLIQSAKK